MEGHYFSLCAGWLPDAPTIGQCYFDRARGVEAMSFSYDRKWLAAYPSIMLDPDLSNVEGRQYVPRGKTMFGFVSDCAPDRWGRRLMDRRERIDAEIESRQKRKLLESDYLLGVHDGGRLGGIRFRDSQGRYLSDREELAAPPITELRTLQQAAVNLETDEKHENEWLKMLIAPGSSLGGARPKANVVDIDGSMWIAKFPSKMDEINVGAWEMVAHDLAGLCGIAVPEARLEHFLKEHATFLVKRFDRYAEGGVLARNHFASAMTMLGETDGSSQQHSYLELLSFLEEQGSAAEEDIRQLWKRMVFNICITNADDHLRNHGFLLQQNGWRLSPAYDVNPDYEQTTLSLAVNFDNPDVDLRLVLEIADYFRLSNRNARNMIRQMQMIIRKQWPILARKYGISKEEQKRMQPAFSECERELGD